MKLRILNIFLLLFAFAALRAQSPLDTLAMRAIMVNQLFPQERVYLHFDNTAYYLGETMWFKAYTTSGIADNERPISKVLYVELCAPEGYVVETKKYKLDENGRCNGEFELKPSLLSGYYEVRAYTRYMLNWGDEAVFSRVFPVYDKVNGDNYEFKNMLDRKRSFMYRGEWKTNELPEADLKFYPEGGHIVEGIETTIAYELKGYDGVHGEDSVTIYGDNEVVAKSVPMALGMGSFKLTPQRGVKYRAEIEITRHKNGKKKKFKFSLPKVESEGVALAVTRDEKDIYIAVKNNLPATANLGCVIVNNGYMQLYETFTSDAKEKRIQMPLDRLAEGVNRVVLFADSVPLAERQFFVTHDSIAAGDISTVKLKAKVNGLDPKDIILQPHEKITLTVEREDGKPIDPDAEFSLSVSDIDHRQKMSYEHNMYTHTLLGSQLKGYIPDATRYFDPENPRREEELDLLMLTHGWTSYDWSKLARSHIDVRHHAEEGIELSGEIYTRQPNNKIGQKGTHLLFPVKYGTLNFKFMHEGENAKFYKFHTTKKGRFRIRTGDFYGERIAELSPSYLPYRPKEYRGMRFVLDRYFSPPFRFYDYWERNSGRASKFVKLDTTVTQLDALEYQLAEVDIVKEKKEEKRERPPRSEIRFNFVDEWEYAQDVTYFSLNRDFDTTKVAVRLDVSNVGNIDTGDVIEAVQYSDEEEIPLKEVGDWDIYNSLHSAKAQSRFLLITNSLTPAKVLQSTFWRYNFNWAYWVQSIVVKGEYNSDSIPEKDDIFLEQRDKYGSGIIRDLMSFKEFTIRSDEELRKQFTNEVKNWRYKGMPHGLDSILVEGFLTRHYIPTKDNKMIDGFPGSILFQQQMKGSSIEFTYEPESTNNPTYSDKLENIINPEKEKVRGNGHFKPVTNRYDPTFEAKVEAGEKLRGLGSFNPYHPNYVACFIPYSNSEWNLKQVPDFSKADRIRYTMLRGYTESKKFYSPDYSIIKPDASKKDYRRTLLWAPTAKGGSVSLTFYNSSNAKHINVDIQGRDEKTIYGNADNISTRENSSDAKVETAFMKIWKELSNTEISPDILTKCNKLTEKGNIEYTAGRYDEAVKYFREAAKYGFPSAVANLGKCYYDGDGVGISRSLAMRYFNMAAEKGNILAMHYLGECYHKGESIEKNDSIAYAYYNKAANEGYAQSQRMMGVFHENGIYVEKNSAEALKWYTRAAERNDPDALYKVGAHQVEQDSINGLSKRQLRKSPAIDYMRRAARNGNKDAQAFIVKCFAEGKYLKKSNKKSFEWMKSIAELGDDNAQMYVAYCYEKGRGTDLNHKRAYWLYKKLAEKGNEFAIAKVQEYETLKFFTYNSPKPPGIK
ncbi:MAG: SEL1-like repeat protein [Bacteroidaceae bacterium]|nr:SEL1-like repeat protein [Bacteroidaceae bacterium]